MNFQFDMLSADASDFLVDLRMTASHNLSNTTAPSRAHNAREVDVAAQRRTDENQFAWRCKGLRRLVTLVDKIGHEARLSRLSLRESSATFAERKATKQSCDAAWRREQWLNDSFHYFAELSHA